MRLDSTYEYTPEQFLNLTHASKMPVWCKKTLKNLKIRSTLRVRIKGNIENGNCYCIRIDYDDMIIKRLRRRWKRRRRGRRRRKRKRRRRSKYMKYISMSLDVHYLRI